MAERLTGIKTNIITGFLGAGKSTVILDLMKLKPANETWAILVNEFGEVGIDGGLLAASGDDKVFIREVPGGCMCCSAGLPMQMAMNMLIARSRPDRLIIEPTGLGHPFEVVNVLASEHYQDVLDIRATMTLVDARNISDNRYRQHTTFNEQLEMADVVLASKADLYGDDDLDNLSTYLKTKGWSTRQSFIADRSRLTLDLLEPDAAAFKSRKLEPVPASDDCFDQPQQIMFPPEGYIRLSNQGEGFVSHGWIFEPTIEFDHQQVSQLLWQTNVDRAKGLLRTDQGNFGFNIASDTLIETPLQELDDSRLEIITSSEFDADDFQDRLLSAGSIAE